MTATSVDLDHLEVNGLDFAYLHAGDPSDPLALCLHGFPDVADGWRPLLAKLSAEGFHAVAPYARGYAPTAVPDDGSSPISAWAADANAFHEALGATSDAAIIGHDWGALGAYAAMGSSTDRWRIAVTASVPPTSVMAPLLTTYDVLKAFWYQRFFLDPTAEDVVAADDFAFIERLWADWSPGLDAADALVPVKAALAARANLSAALSTYRTLADLSLQPPQFMNELMAMMAPITVPTMYLHGEHDGCVPGLDIAAVETALPPGSEVHLLGSAGHFVQYDQPGLVNELIAGFIAS